jgi:cellulose synthase/poly-beta-1,6-N-acetylglucosamine synthase-like glycosyltransferase
MTSALLASFWFAATFYLTVTEVWSPVQTLFGRRFHERRIRQSAASRKLPDKLPSADAIVPCCHEEPRPLLAWLRSIASQDYPGQVTAYVADDGSMPGLSPAMAGHRSSTRSAVRSATCG